MLSFFLSPPLLLSLLFHFFASGIPSSLPLRPPSARAKDMTLLSCSCAVVKAAPSRPGGAKPVNSFGSKSSTKRPLPLLRPFRPRPSVAAVSSPSLQGEQSGFLVMPCRRAGLNSNGFSRKQGRRRRRAWKKERGHRTNRKLASSPLSLTSAKSSPSLSLPSLAPTNLQTNPRKQHWPTSPLPAQTTPGPPPPSAPSLWSSSE